MPSHWTNLLVLTYLFLRETVLVTNSAPLDKDIGIRLDEGLFLTIKIYVPLRRDSPHNNIMALRQFK